MKYVITLDADTILGRDSARQLIGTLAHPLNRAQADPRTGRVVHGYGLLQPRTEIVPASANYSRFSRIFAGDIGLDLYTHAVSNVYQDLFGSGIYVGKGIYDVDAFENSLAGRVPENTLLSHDLFEGIHGRVGLVTDIVLYEEYPPSYLTYVRRQRRWTRGDWQLLPWLLPRVRTRHGPAADHGRLRRHRYLEAAGQPASQLAAACLAPVAHCRLAGPARRGLGLDRGRAAGPGDPGAARRHDPYRDRPGRHALAAVGAVAQGWRVALAAGRGFSAL